jgi:hypothetical protein
MRERYTDSPDEGSRGAPSEPRSIREVRRYPNRRLYDVTTRAYVGLEAIDAWITEGASVRVIDARSGEDITVLVLAPLAVEKLQVRLRSHPDASRALHRWIRGELPLGDEAPSPAAPPSVPERSDPASPLDTRLADIEARLTALEQSRRPR